MSSGHLVLVCRATGERLPIEELRQRGWVISLATIRSERVYAVPHRAGTEPASWPLDAPEGIEPAEFFDRVCAAAIADCKSKSDASS